MAFSSWFSRLRASSPRAILDGFRGRALSQHRHSAPAQRALAATAAVSGASDGRRFWLWSSALVPLAVAASAGSLALRSSPESSLCEAPDQDAGGVKVGGKGNAAYLVKGSHREVPRELIDELVAICGENMTMDYEERSFHGKPQNSFHKAVNIPDVVVFPRSEEEVSKIVKSCNEHKVSIVPYGGATSIEGHTLSPNGGVCIDMTLMKRVKALHVDDMDVVVEPGIGWMELNEYLEPHGLFFPLDPGPGATIGGICASRCSGSLAVSM